MKNNICRCGGKAEPSKGIMNIHRIYTSDPDTEFTTEMRDCLKCTSCGHSWIPAKGNKLISSHAYGRLVDTPETSDSDYRRLRRNYDFMLRNTLQLGFFIPCTPEGEVLEEPKIKDYEGGIFNNTYNFDVKRYRQALSRVLFEGGQLASSKSGIHNVNIEHVFIGIGYKNGIHKTIEDLVPYNLTLTENAMKKLIS